MRALITLLFAAALALAPVRDSRAAQSEPVLPQPRTEAEHAVAAIVDHEQRIARVAWRLWSANTDLCPIRHRSAGWALHAGSLYGGADRAAAERLYGLAGDLPGVSAAPESSPAHQAGLRVGDLIVAVDGSALAEGDGRQSDRGLEANISVLDRALAAGDPLLTIRRHGQTRTVKLTPQEVCGYRIRHRVTSQRGARADRRGVYVDYGLARFTQTDEELAFVIAHELGHLLAPREAWREAEAEGRTRAAAAFRLGPGENRERAADRLGLYAHVRAGYDAETAPAFLRRWAEADVSMRMPQLGHASAPERARRLEALIPVIRAKQAAGQPLIP